MFERCFRWQFACAKLSMRITGVTIRSYVRNDRFCSSDTDWRLQQLDWSRTLIIYLSVTRLSTNHYETRGIVRYRGRRTARDLSRIEMPINKLPRAARLQAFKALFPRRVRTLMYRACFCDGEASIRTHCPSDRKFVYFAICDSLLDIRISLLWLLWLSGYDRNITLKRHHHLSATFV